MASQPPAKPWERLIPGSMGAPVNYRSTDFASVGPAPSGLGPIPSGPPVLTRMAPPLPPRPLQPSYRPYSSLPSYTPYGSSPYSPYGPGGYALGGYSLGGALGYNRFQAEEVAPSRFVQQAEESSRGAFQSIESIVHAFSSVSLMMDATYSALYSSFRAGLDVANHLSRLRLHFTKVLSAFALVRTLRYLYRRLQRMMGLREDLDADSLWTDSAGPALGREEEPRVGSGKSWPIFLFFAVVLGGPYLIWRLLNSAQGPENNGSDWASGVEDHIVARAEYDFVAASEEEISLQAGDMLNLAPKEQQPKIRGWLLASVDGHSTGLVPANYVKVLGKRRGKGSQEAGSIAQGPALNPALTTVPKALFESTFREILDTSSIGPASSSIIGPASSSIIGPAPSNTDNNTVVTIPDKSDL